MTLNTFDFEGTDGATLTAANTGADFWTGTGTWSATFSSPGAHGTTCAKIDVAKDAASWGLGRLSLAAPNTQAAGRVYFQLTADLATGTNPNLVSIRSSSAGEVAISQRQGMWLQVYISQGPVTLDTHNYTLTANTWYRLEWVIDTTAGSFAMNIYQGDDTTPLNNAGDYTATGLSLGGFEVTQVDLGPSTKAQNGGIYYYDALALNDGATTEIGPATQPTPQGGVKAWSGTTWAPVKGWSGTAWVPVKAWSGTTWV